MILPSKHLPHDRALLSVGARILAHLSYPETVSGLWEEFSKSNTNLRPTSKQIPYDWFILALDLLYTLGAISLEENLIKRVTA